MTSLQEISAPPDQRSAAERIAARLAEKAFEGRKGHGNAPITERHWKRPQLEAWLVGAFELGAQWERGRTK